MLELLHAYTGCPKTGLQFLVLPRETLLLYPSVDCIVVLNSRTFAFLRALAFWEAFPGARLSNDSVRCLAIDPGMKLAVASMGYRIAAWVLSASGSTSNQPQDAWRLHSTLVIPDNQEVTALDCKSGLLAVGTCSNLSVYTLILENDIPTWSRKWTRTTKTPTRIRFSPSLMYIATISAHAVHLHSTTSGRQTQSIPHPRPLTDLSWRRPRLSSHPTAHVHNDDPILYTTTADGTLRVFLPVLDAPQRVQLHAALDAASAVPLYAEGGEKDKAVQDTDRSSSVFPLDRDAMLGVLQMVKESGAAEDARSRRVREIAEEGWDLFLRVLADGSLVVQAVANIDRRPPTLLRHFTLLQSAPGLLQSPPPAHLYVLPSSPAHSPAVGISTLTLITSPPLASYALAPLPFFDARADGLTLLAHGADPPAALTADVRNAGRRELLRFVRTPEGEGVTALYADGSGQTWRVLTGGRGREMTLERRGGWGPADDPDAKVDRVVVLDRGRAFVTYSSASSRLTLHTTPPCTLTVPPLVSLFSLTSPSSSALPPYPAPASSATLVGVGADHSIYVYTTTLAPSPALCLQSHSSLPLSTPPEIIVPVDPMAWSGSYASGAGVEAHDVLLSISADGELAFWVLEGLPQSAALGTNGHTKSKASDKIATWRCTGRVRTGKKGFSRAVCSSAKKSVLVVPGPDGEELTIWDSKMSEFSSGLEYREVLSLSDPVNDLDWTATPDSQSILAVGFAHRVELLCQQRMTYFDETPGWGRCWTIDVGRMFPHPIGDSIWLARGSLLIGTGHLLFLYGQSQTTADSSSEEPLFEHVARHNGPLDDYHPQMLLQCLLWEKVELVKKVIVELAKLVEDRRSLHKWKNIPINEYYKKDEAARAAHPSRKPKYSLLFSMPDLEEETDEDQFSRSRVEQLLGHLEEQPLPHLTPNEHASLLVLIQTTLEIEEQRRALDANGLRYLISMRVFYITNRRLSAPSTPASARSGAVSRTIKPRQRLRYRDIVWAFHSESQELLLSTSMAACGGKMTWPDARALGVFLWMHPGESMRAHMEVIARNQYMAGDNRDPTACSLFYFALGKIKLVYGLWRQAAWHKEHAQMLKFLNNDFTQPRWRTAAQKNAFALLSKRRFEYAAAFFLLGGSLKDAVNVCIKNLNDFQLAVALARVVEGDEGPILRDMLNNTILPLAFKEGNRWLASWAFWLLHRRDLAVRILVTPLRDVASSFNAPVTEIGEPHYDDPSLALLFSQLKLRSLQTAKGTSEISGRTEFNFVLQIARVFCRMGCPVLALDLVRTWSFQRPSVVIPDARPAARPPSPISTRFALEPALRRRSSIMIDMDPASGPPTRVVSPAPAANGTAATSEEPLKEDEGDLVARKAGLGSLMQSAKQTVNVPEFDMGAFF